MTRTHLSHSWAVAVLYYWVLLGVGLVLAPVLPGWTPVPVLARSDSWVTSLVGAIIAVGAVVLIVAGRRPMDSRRYTAEIAALIACGLTWVGYAQASGYAFPQELTGWAQGLAFALACALRLLEVIRSERRTRANVRAMREADGDV